MCRLKVLYDDKIKLERFVMNKFLNIKNELYLNISQQLYYLFIDLINY